MWLEKAATSSLFRLDYDTRAKTRDMDLRMYRWTDTYTDLYKTTDPFYLNHIAIHNIEIHFGPFNGDLSVLTWS